MRKLISILTLVVCLGVSMQSNAQASCNDRPIVNDFTPKTGFIGSTVTISGANFSPTPAENQVFFGATEATIISSSFGTLEVRVPEGSTTALISVKNQCELSAYSKTHFNGIFCPTPLTTTTYQNVAQQINSVGAYNMISQDMDNDGLPEVISSGSGLTIAQNNSIPGTINFNPINISTSFNRSIASADFDGDGLKDLVSDQAVYRNTSTGPGNINVVNAGNSRSVSSYQIGVGDFNNDGKIDLIGQNGAGVYVAFNTSTGPGNFSFTNRQFIQNLSGGRCNGIQVADVDGDGKADFLASLQQDKAASLRNTTPDGSFVASFEAAEYWASNGSYPYRAMIADFNKDGKIDFTSCNFRNSGSLIANVAIWINTSTVGDISFAPTINLPSPNANYRIGVGDVDGDGYADVVTKSSGSNVFSVYKNTSTGIGGTPTFGTRIDYTSSTRAEASGIVVGDFDGDFVPDIATSGTSSRTIRFHRNTSAQVDQDPPTAICQDITVALDPFGNVAVTADMIDNGSGDACGLGPFLINGSDKLTFTCADVGTNNVVLTVTDLAGNTTTCNAIVTVAPAAIIVAGQTTVCQGETITLNANTGDSYQWFMNSVAISGATSQTYIATETGDYTVEVINSGGCSGVSDPVTATVNENPTVDVTPGGTAYICPNGTATLTATQSAIYQWMQNGVDIPNATQQVYSATITGNYSVRVIDLFGCTAVSNTVVVATNPPEIDVTGNGIYGTVFPNQDYTQTITISNTGTNNLDIENLAVSGPDAGFFTLSGFSSPGAVAPGTSVEVDVTFNGQDLATYAAILSFDTNDCDEPFFTIPLDAEISCPAITAEVTPYALDCFGYDHQLTIIPNGGAEPYTVTASGGTLSTTEPNVFLFDGFTTATNTVTITIADANGCESGLIEYLLTNPTLVVAGTAVSTETSCINTFDGTITYSGQTGGTPHVDDPEFPDGWGYFLLGPNGLEINQGSPTFTNLAPGFYDVGAGDANGCGTGLYSIEVLNGDNEAPILVCPSPIEINTSQESCLASITLPVPEIIENCGLTSASISINGSVVFDYVFVDTMEGGLDGPRPITFGPDGNLYVSNFGPSITEGSILRYDGTTGVFIDEFVSVTTGLLQFPRGLGFGPDGNLYVASRQTNEILRFDGSSGAFIDAFVPAGGNLVRPTGLIFGPGDDLYVAGAGTNEVLRYDGITGNFEGVFASGLSFPVGLSFGPDSNLYVANLGTSAILRFDGTTGTYIDDFVPVNSGDLQLPEALEFGADGNLYVTSFGNGKVLSYDGTTGAFVNEVSSTGIGLSAPDGLTFGPDGNLYVSNTGLDQIVRYPMASVDLAMGVSTVTFNATDSSGLSGSCDYTITVTDNIPPVVACQNITIPLDENGTASIEAEDLTALGNLTSDNWIGFIGIFIDENFVGGDVVAIEDIKSTIDVGNDRITLQPNFNPSYPNNYDNPTLQGSTYIETFGTLAGRSFDFTGEVVSNTLDSRYEGFAFIRIFDDNFDLLSEINSPLIPGTDFSVQYNNSIPEASIIQYGFTVEGTTGAFDEEASLGNAVVQGMTVKIAPYDNCGIASIVASQTDFDCSQLGENTVTLTVTDVNGNVATCDAIVTVVDNIAPTIIANDLVVECDGEGNIEEFENWLNAYGISEIKMYWTNLSEGTIRTANDDGTDETVLFSGLNNPSGIAVDVLNGKIYWTEWFGSNNVRRANLDGTDIENLVNNMDAANVITLDVANNYMYWSDWNDNIVLRANLDGSNITTLISSGVQPEGIALDVDAGHMYIGNISGPAIVRANLDGSNLVTINADASAGNVRGVDIDLDAGKLYWASVSSNSIYRANLDGSDFELVTAVPGAPFGLALDLNAGKVYWSTINTALGRANLDGSDNQTLLQGAGGNFYLDVAGELFNDAELSSDNCGIVSWSNDFTEFGEDPVGTTTVIFTATDASGNSSSQASTFTIQDTTAPLITCPTNITSCATSEAGAVLTYVTPVVTDNCGEVTPILVAGLESGSVFPIGTTTIRYEATDAGNNTVACEFTVTVNPIPNVDPIDDIVVCNGEDISEIIFEGNIPNGQYTWTNDDTSIGLAASGIGDISGFTATNTTNAPITATITVAPASPEYLYISTTGDSSVSVISTLTNTIVATIPVGGFPYGTSASVDGTKVYITNRNDNSVSIIDTATNTVEATVDVGGRPSGILANQDGTRVFVGVSNAGTGGSGLAVIDTFDNSVTAPSLTGNIAPWGTAVSPDGSRLYATVGSSISVISTADYSEIVNIPVGASLFRYAISPDGSRLYVTDLGGNTVQVIDTASNTVVTTLSFGASPNAITINPDGSKVYVSIFGGTTVEVINTDDNTVSASIEVGPNQGGISVSSDGSFVYLTRQGLNSVTVINADTNTVETDIAVNSSAISYGNFVSSSTYCAVEPITFTITVNPSPVVTIDQSELPEFCQGAVLQLTASSDLAVSYSWAGSDETSNVLDVSADGVYTVTVTSAEGCTTTEDFEVTGFDAEVYLSSYTLLAHEEIHLHGNNTVSSGAVGVLDEDGDAKIHDETVVAGFVKAADIDVDDDSSVGSEVLSPVDVILPEFIYNTASNDDSMEVTVEEGETVILNGNVYDKVEVKEGGTVVFTNSNVFLKELKTKDGGNVEFTNSTNLFVQKHVELDKNTNFNQTGSNTVVIYAEEEVKVDEGSNVNANIYSLKDIEAKGKDDNITNMNGLFIAKKIKGDDYVNWGAGTTCSPAEIIVPEPVASCDCKGGITSITFAYDGSFDDLTTNSGIIADNGDGTFTITNNGEKLEKDLEISDGANTAEIHTSCSQDILGITFDGGVTVLGYTDNYGNTSDVEVCPIIPEECECKGGIVSLTFEYAGEEELSTNSGIITDNGDGTFTITNDGEKLDGNLEISDGTDIAEIHTSCSDDILGVTFAGDLTVTEYLDNEGNLSSLEGCVPAPEPCECNGGMVSLTFEYGGEEALTTNSGIITDNGDGTYTITNGGDKLDGNLEISDGTNIAEIHTSCSDDILGVTFAGDITMIAYMDNDGNIGSVDGCVPAPEPCECNGGIVSLTFSYDGEGELSTNSGSLTDNGDGTYTVTAAADEKLEKDLEISDGTDTAEIHTSCSQDILGVTFAGGVTVIAHTDNYGNVCSVPSDDDGGVKRGESDPLEEAEDVSSSGDTDVPSLVEFDVKAWPVPSKSHFNLKIMTINTTDKVEVSVVDISNKLIHVDNFIWDQTYKFGEKLSAGVYFVRIVQGANIKIIRVMKR